MFGIELGDRWNVVRNDVKRRNDAKYSNEQLAAGSR